MMEIYRPKYFSPEELAPKELCLKKSSDEIFDLFDRGLLKALDRVREKLGKPITINNWRFGGQFSQRGIRTDPNVGAPKSAHRIGKALDFDADGMSAEEVRQWIIVHQKEFPEIRRMEAGVNWVHIDCVEHTHGADIYLFKA